MKKLPESCHAPPQCERTHSSGLYDWFSNSLCTDVPSSPIFSWGRRGRLQANLATDRKRHLTKGKRAKRTKLDFRCTMCRSGARAPWSSHSLVPRPHFSSRPKRFGSRGPCENVRPRQKSSKVRQKWDSSMAMVNKTSVSNFKVKNTSLKHTDGKGIFKRILSFLQVDKGRLFRIYKIVLREI